MDETTQTTAAAVAVPVLEEIVHVAVRPVGRGGASVHLAVSERDEVVERDLFQDAVSVERRPVGRVVETAPGVREEGDVTIIPVLEEQLVVTKRLVLKEEIHVRRRRTVAPWTETVTLRRETATVKPIVEPGA